MEKEELYITFGCFGLVQDNFISCGGVENRILLIEETLFNYKELMNYIDNCRLFDKPMFDYNAIRHFIFNLRDRFDQPTKRLWSEKKFDLYQKFTIDHRHCGLYLKLILVNPEIPVSQPEPKGILIPGTNFNEPVKIQKLKVIRGRS